MWTVYKLNNGKPNDGDYGFGWVIDSQNGHKVVEHDGAWQGFTCNISRYVDDSLTVVVLTNLDAGHSRPVYASHVIAGLVDSALLPRRLVAIPDNEPQIAAPLRTILNQSVVSVGQLSRLWPGGVLTLVDREPSPDNPSLEVSEFRLTKGDQSILIIYGLNAHGGIAALLFQPDREYQT